ncbi:MAG: MFS transporter [Dehalococcoidia bacterium]|nr:MFS transporter [Dehalococcoidia bacterium]
MEARATRAVFAIAVGSGLASLSMNFWIPFVPLYMKQLGATSDANALFWVGVAAGAQGVARLVAGPVWGILSDRYGRKSMFLRALYSGSFTMAIAAFATQPWHIVAAFTMQGLFSGFNPAATALTSVSVPDRRLNSSLSVVTGAQFLGSTLGPAIGAVLAVAVGYRGAIIGGAMLPAIAGVYATIAVPRDTTGASPETVGEGGSRSGSIRSLLTLQFSLALAVWFFSLAFGQLLRIAAPIALERIVGPAQATAASGVAFTLAGLAGVGGVVVAQRLVRPGRLQYTLIVTSVGVGLGHLVLPLVANATTFIAAFAVIAMLQAAMVPATNTLIAANAPRDRRGTAFGLASGMQAVAFMVGPITAAGFAVVSLNLGFAVLGVLFVALGVMIRVGVREPDL